MAAFRRALDVGCDVIEFDCHISRDGVVVVIHDETLERTTDGRGFVRERTWKEIQKLDAGSWFAPEFAGQWVPRLDEIIMWARGTPLALAIEVKQPTPARGLARYDGIEERIAELVSAFEIEARTVLISFDHGTVRRLRELLPDVATGVIYGGGSFVDPLVLARDAGASAIFPWWESVSPELCGAAHEAGLHVHAWGTPEPPDPEVTSMLVRAGVDSLAANNPRDLRRILVGPG